MNGPIPKVKQNEAEKVAMWNKSYEPGQKVMVIDEDRQWHVTQTLSPAFLFQNHTAMVRVAEENGVSGDWDLEYVMAVD